MPLLVQQLEEIRDKDSTKRGRKPALPALPEGLRGWLDGKGRWSRRNQTTVFSQQGQRQTEPGNPPELT